jgi:hypothetical protein
LGYCRWGNKAISREETHRSETRGRSGRGIGMRLARARALPEGGESQVDTWLIILIIVLAVLFLGGGGWGWSRRR